MQERRVSHPPASLALAVFVVFIFFIIKAPITEFATSHQLSPSALHMSDQLFRELIDATPMERGATLRRRRRGGAVHHVAIS